ncbi:MAG: N-acetyltransferase family protein, partial [Pseudomonadota bacterium]
VYVSAAHRGLGLGTALLTALIDRARAAGLRHLVGGIDAGQAASLALHRRQGFVEVGRLPEIGLKFGRPRTLVLMQRALAEGQP